MELETLTWLPGAGWSAPLPARLDGERTLVLAFSAPTIGDEDPPLAELRAAFPRAALLGCSTAGEIHGAKLLDGSIAVAVVRFAATAVRFACAPVGGDSLAAGRDLAGRLAGPDLRAVLVLSEGNDVNGTALLRGLGDALPPEVVVTGGLAGDGPRFQRTWTLRDGRPATGHVSAVGLYGSAVRVTHGSRGGWDVLGPERRVTRSDGNVLYELDGRPALQLYKEYLGDRASGLPATALLFPLLVRERHEGGRALVRTVLGVDEEAQSMRFAGDVPQGCSAQLMRANFDRLIDGATDAAREARPETSDGPLLAIAISCVGRRLVLGERTEEEIEGTLDALPPGARQIGFYSYGEISPLVSGPCELHNQTMTITTIGEAECTPS